MSLNWAGFSSASDNIFEQLHRLFHEHALVKDNESEIEQAIKDIGDPLRRDLDELSHVLVWAAERFSQASDTAAQLDNHR